MRRGELSWPAQTRRLQALACSVALCGCATVYEGQFDWKLGWREGTIEQVVPESKVHQLYVPGCTGSTAEWLAKVAYRRGHTVVYRVMPLPDPSFRVTDAVYVNVTDCGLPLHHRSN